MSLIAVQAANIRSSEIIEKYHYGINCNCFEALVDWVILDFIQECIDADCYGAAKTTGLSATAPVETDCTSSIADDTQFCSENSITLECVYSATGVDVYLIEITLEDGTNLSEESGFHFPYNLPTTQLNVLTNDLIAYFIGDDVSVTYVGGALTISIITVDRPLNSMVLSPSSTGVPPNNISFEFDCL